MTPLDIVRSAKTDAKELAWKIANESFNRCGAYDVDLAASIIAAALAEQDAVIARLEAELRTAMIRSNQYAKRLVSEGYDDVTWYAVQILPPDEKKGEP